MSEKTNIFWMRRDLRLEDNHALFRALGSEFPVFILFIMDTEILDELPPDDARLNLIHKQLKNLQNELKKYGSSILLRKGKPVEVFRELFENFDIKYVFANEDYEPYAKQRDKKVKKLINDFGSELKLFKDQVFFAPDEVLKADGTPYKVFTPYMRAWRKTYEQTSCEQYPSEKNLDKLKYSNEELPELHDLDFVFRDIDFPKPRLSKNQIINYEKNRDKPYLNGTTNLSFHLRFGMISVRKLYKMVENLSYTYFNELIWREFYMMILGNYPQVVDNSFKPAYDNIEWRNNEEEFDRWCRGETGYPIVDAGMRQLNQTGYMHNRLRMITASFLVKDLLIDWRWGEAYFAKKLLDYELSSNNGGWQWAAGSGCDAAPYFRIFNPDSQQKKFDPEYKFVRSYVPEFDKPSYVDPIVDHKYARGRTLEAYKQALNN